MQVEKAILFILGKLGNELPRQLTYHNYEHTKSVIEHAAEIATLEGISEDDMRLLRTAAAFHDTGFLEKEQGHEEISCRMAREFLPQFEYSPAAIDRVCNMIMATQMPQRPADHLSQILCDADLYYLGTDNYGVIAERLYREFQNNKRFPKKMEWQRQQIRFIQTHKYFTASANQMLAGKRDKNLIILKARTESEHSMKNHETTLWDIFFIITGVVITSFALKGFLVPNHFFDGGVTGLSLLFHEVYHVNLAYVIVAANLPFVVMSYFIINKGFAVKTFLCILFLGICLLYPGFPIITSDKLLVSIFGGFFLGLGIGLTMRAGCAVDGIEVLALYTLRRSSFTISEIILGLNIIIFSLAAFRFGIQIALYSMLTYFSAYKTIDFIIEGIEAYTGVTIISAQSELVKHQLVNELGRGITVFKGERGFLPGKFDLHDDCDIIFTVITRLEMRKLKNMVTEIDPAAFVFASTIKETSGGIIRKRHIH
jgi:uncharacterized membrane-anchored protein YitT (DUF2179 family)